MLWVPIGIALFLHENISYGYLLEMHYFLHDENVSCGAYWKCFIFCMKMYLVGTQSQ